MDGSACQLLLSWSLCLSAVPPNIAELKNLEVLNMFNNQIEELPTQISSLQKLKHLNLGYVCPQVCRFILLSSMQVCLHAPRLLELRAAVPADSFTLHSYQ